MKFKIVLGFFILTSVIILFYSMVCVNQKVDDRIEEGVLAIKFMDNKTYPHSIDEKMFWENSEFEFAKININLEDNGNGFLKDIKDLKKISDGLSENFDYAFILKSRNKIDTIYASLSRNLWTLKEKGKFIYYKDNEEELKNVLQNYSSFFSECW